MVTVLLMKFRYIQLSRMLPCLAFVLLALLVSSIAATILFFLHFHSFMYQFITRHNLVTFLVMSWEVILKLMKLVGFGDGFCQLISIFFSSFSLLFWMDHLMGTLYIWWLKTRRSNITLSFHNWCWSSFKA